MCGLPIDYGAPRGDPRGFECDEIVPVSLGGSPYDPANVDAAHRCCNNWRRAMPARAVDAVRAEALARFGGWRTPEEFVAMAKVVRSSRSIASPLAAGKAAPPATTTDW